MILCKYKKYVLAYLYVNIFMAIRLFLRQRVDPIDIRLLCGDSTNIELGHNGFRGPLEGNWVLIRSTHSSTIYPVRVD